VGYQALLGHTTGSRNIAIGFGSMDGTAGDADDAPASVDNVFIGYDAGGGNWEDDEDSNYNVGIGSYTLDAALDGASGNTAIGYNSCSGVNSGSFNVCVGGNSGATLTTGNENICIGHASDVPAGAENRAVIGYNVTGVADDSVTLGNADVTAVYMASDSGATVYAAGVNFPDDATAGVADVNTLDAYEEGTWTATIADGSANAISTSANTCAYIKIGKLVFISGRIVCDGLASASGGLSITNLPFTTKSTNDGASAIPIGYLAGMGIEDNVSVIIRPSANSTAAAFFVWDGTDSDNQTALTAAELSANGQFQFGGTYHA